MQALDQRIQALLATKHLQEKLNLHIELVKQKIDARLAEKADLEHSVNESLETLEALDKLTARSLFSRSLGNQEQQYQRARQEYLINFLKLRTWEERIVTKQYEVEVLERKLASLTSVDELLAKLIFEKKQYLKIKNKELAGQIIGLESSIRVQDVELKEIEEAISSGQWALVALDHLLAGLNTITSWQPEASLLSQGTVLSYKEKSFSRDLLVEIRAANKNLDNFLDELHDVSVQYDLDYRRYLDRLGKFVDNLFDSLISDWIFYQQIKTSKANVEGTIDQVKRIIGMLRLDYLEVDKRKSSIQERLDQLVISAQK